MKYKIFILNINSTLDVLVKLQELLNDDWEIERVDSPYVSAYGESYGSYGYLVYILKK